MPRPVMKECPIPFSVEPYCRKCGRKTDLERHHIIPYRHVPKNNPDNLIWLCTACHLEWGAFECLQWDFQVWLAVPPAVMLAEMYIEQMESGVPDISTKVINGLHRFNMEQVAIPITWKYRDEQEAKELRAQVLRDAKKRKQ